MIITREQPIFLEELSINDRPIEFHQALLMQGSNVETKTEEPTLYQYIEFHAFGDSLDPYTFFIGGDGKYGFHENEICIRAQTATGEKLFGLGVVSEEETTNTGDYCRHDVVIRVHGALEETDHV